MFLSKVMVKSILNCVLQRRACTQIQNFKRNYLENYNDSEHAVKTKNAPFFMIFPNISFFHMIVNYWTGPLSSPNRVIFEKNFGSKKHEKIAQIPVFYTHIKCSKFV